MDGSHVGAVAGASAGVYKGITAVITGKSLLLISWGNVVETAILALIGGALGWIGAEIARGVSRLYRKWRQK